MSNRRTKEALVIGAGPAGLTAGVELLKKNNFRVKVIEKDLFVGGLSRTTEYKNCKFDIGPHHFITSSQRVEKWWKKLMKGEDKKGNSFAELKRLTRIYYKKHFFHYPLQPLNVLKGLSIIECSLCVFSYMKARFVPIKQVKSLQDFITNRFGGRLFRMFFKTYSEKLWGISCQEISSSWASQRIKGFSLYKAVLYAFFGRWFKKNIPRTIADKFYYPEQGAGTLWCKAAEKITENPNGYINLGETVVSIKHKNFIIESISSCSGPLAKGGAKKLKDYNVDYLFSSMPLKNLVLSLDPVVPENIFQAAKKLKCRSLITVNFIINKKNVCPDHWLYMHEQEVKMLRIGNMNNFSSKLVDDENHTALSLEYFTFTTDPFWKLSDQELLDMAKNELHITELVKQSEILDGMILREENAYPIYDPNYKSSMKIILDYLKKFSNLNLMGRNGLHRYNNMDIAMLSAFDAVDKVASEEKAIIKKLHKNRSFVQTSL